MTPFGELVANVDEMWANVIDSGDGVEGFAWLHDMDDIVAIAGCARVATIRSRRVANDQLLLKLDQTAEVG